jgi:hypothetical protein
VRAGGALEGRILEVVRGFLERVPPRERQDLLVGGDEVGQPGNRGDDERLPGGVDVGLCPRQHPHARQLIDMYRNKDYTDRAQHHQRISSSGG